MNSNSTCSAKPESDRDVSNLILDKATTPLPFLGYVLLSAVRDAFPDQHVTETSEWEFGFEEFAKEGHCEIEASQELPPQKPLHIGTAGAIHSFDNAIWDVRWKDQRFKILRASWATSCGPEKRHWTISEDESVAVEFFESVCKWCSELRGVVLSFANGYWQRSKALYKSIQSTTMDSLILPGDQKQTIISDFERFLESRERYKTYGAPWKRGVLFSGPPGNGKTHFIRALIRHLKIPCFYVKSFETHDQFKSSGILEVYRTVRRTTPCILVLEDLDSLINDDNRTYFLNELDGFESNDGIITVATTNYPEKLDSAILDRPSRFDQKWHFGLPCAEGRAGYIRAWNQHLPEAANLSESEISTIADGTAEFSYAYLKELCLGAILKWVQGNEQGNLFDTMQAHRDLLVAQSPVLKTPMPNSNATES